MHRAYQWTVTLWLALAPLGASASTLISEVFYDAIGSDNGLSFVELYGTPGSSLDGLILEGINGSNGAAGPTIADIIEGAEAPFKGKTGQFVTRQLPGALGIPYSSDVFESIQRSLNQRKLR